MEGTVSWLHRIGTMEGERNSLLATLYWNNGRREEQSPGYIVLEQWKERGTVSWLHYIGAMGGERTDLTPG